jgi:hypothetical protein
MPTLVLRDNISSAANAPAMPARPVRQAKPRDRSLEGVLIFSGIGFGLTILAVAFRVLELPAPVF